MKSLQQFVTEAQLKKVYSDFEDALDALNWLENDIRPGEYGVASVIIDGRVGDLTFGFDVNTASRRDNKNDAEDLWLHYLGGHLNISDGYKDIPRGEFADNINNIIRKRGNKM